MTAVRPALIARLYRAIEENRMSDAVLLLSQVFSYYGRSRHTRDVVFLSELRKLGDEYLATQDPLTAEEHFKLALALYEAFFTDQHEEALATIRRLCDLLSAQKRQDELERMLEWAYVIVQRFEAKVEGKAMNALEAINWQTVFDAREDQSLIVNGTIRGHSVGSAINVLLVEDNPDDAEYVVDQLSGNELKVKVDHASELREAIAKVTCGQVDVILLDLGLPDSTALDSFYRMMSSAPQIPIIILTGVDDRSLALKAIKRGAHDYLIKGHDQPTIVLRSIIEAVQRKRDREVERITQTAATRAIEESIETSPFGLMFIDVRGLVRTVNDNWMQLVGGERGDYVGKTFQDLFPWVSQQGISKLMAGGTLEINDVQMGKNHLSLVAWSVRSPGNGVIGALVSTSCASNHCLRAK
jgi:CheY-like chemotaxis protein